MTRRLAPPQWMLVKDFLFSSLGSSGSLVSGCAELEGPDLKSATSCSATSTARLMSVYLALALTISLSIFKLDNVSPERLDFFRRRDMGSSSDESTS